MSSFAPLAPELAEPDRRQRRMKRSCDDTTYHIYEPSTHLLFSYSFRCPRAIARSLPRIGQRSQLFQGCDLAECAKNASAWVESVLESLACTTNESTKRASVLRPRSPLSPHALHVPGVLCNPCDVS
eukprot:scaffold42600_cov66-Cyclotella_meneghiniana.AAC.3